MPVNETQKIVIEEAIAQLPALRDDGIKNLRDRLSSRMKKTCETYVEKLFRNTSSFRLYESGNASHSELRTEIINQLNERFSKKENPEPFSGIRVDGIRSYDSDDGATTATLPDRTNIESRYSSGYSESLTDTTTSRTNGRARTNRSFRL